MSVGHTARVLEEAGIPTVCVFIRAFRHHAYNLKVPRVLITQHMLGRTIGSPGDIETQRHVVKSALELLETAKTANTVLDLEEGIPFAR